MRCKIVKLPSAEFNEAPQKTMTFNGQIDTAALPVSCFGT